jgi:hypothetical protein
MLDNLQTVLQSGIGQLVTVFLLADGSTGRTGVLQRVGVDYLEIIDSPNRAAYLIPFNAIGLITSPPTTS